MADPFASKSNKPSDTSNWQSNVQHRTTTETLRLGETDSGTNSSGTATAISQRKKPCSFQITSVIVGRVNNDGGDDSADDLDESHADDISDVIDSSRITDNETPSYSEDTSYSKEDNIFFNVSNPLCTAPVIPTSAQYGLAIVSPGSGTTPGFNASTPNSGGVVDVNLAVVNPSAVGLDLVNSNKLHEQEHKDMQSTTGRNDRFKVVKIESTEPFKRGRWSCMDFLDSANQSQFNNQQQQSMNVPAPSTGTQYTSDPATVADFRTEQSITNGHVNTVNSYQQPQQTQSMPPQQLAQNLAQNNQVHVPQSQTQYYSVPQQQVQTQQVQQPQVQQQQVQQPQVQQPQVQQQQVPQQQVQQPQVQQPQVQQTQVQQPQQVLAQTNVTQIPASQPSVVNQQQYITQPQQLSTQQPQQLPQQQMQQALQQQIQTQQQQLQQPLQQCQPQPQPQPQVQPAVSVQQSQYNVQQTQQNLQQQALQQQQQNLQQQNLQQQQQQMSVPGMIVQPVGSVASSATGTYVVSQQSAVSAQSMQPTMSMQSSQNQIQPMNITTVQGQMLSQTGQASSNSSNIVSQVPYNSGSTSFTSTSSSLMQPQYVGQSQTFSTQSSQQHIIPQQPQVQQQPQSQPQLQQQPQPQAQPQQRQSAGLSMYTSVCSSNMSVPPICYATPMTQAQANVQGQSYSTQPTSVMNTLPTQGQSYSGQLSQVISSNLPSQSQSYVSYSSSSAPAVSSQNYVGQQSQINSSQGSQGQSYGQTGPRLPTSIVQGSQSFSSQQTQTTYTQPVQQTHNQAYVQQNQTQRQSNLQQQSQSFHTPSPSRPYVTQQPSSYSAVASNQNVVYTQNVAGMSNTQQNYAMSMPSSPASVSQQPIYPTSQVTTASSSSTMEHRPHSHSPSYVPTSVAAGVTSITLQIS